MLLKWEIVSSQIDQPKKGWQTIAGISKKVWCAQLLHVIFAKSTAKTGKNFRFSAKLNDQQKIGLASHLRICMFFFLGVEWHAGNTQITNVKMLQLAIQKEILLGSQEWSQVGVLPSKHLPQHFPWEIIKLVVEHTVFFGQADQPDLPLILNHPPPLCPNETVLSAGFGMRRLPGALEKNVRIQ